MKSKKSMEGGMWWIIMGAIVAIFVAGILLYYSKEGLSSGKKSLDFLGSCENQGEGAQCKIKCDSNENSFYKIGGCNKDSNSNNIIDKDDKLYCCIPKEKK